MMKDFLMKEFFVLKYCHVPAGYNVVSRSSYSTRIAPCPTETHMWSKIKDDDALTCPSQRPAPRYRHEAVTDDVCVYSEHDIDLVL